MSPPRVPPSSPKLELVNSDDANGEGAEDLGPPPLRFGRTVRRSGQYSVLMVLMSVLFMAVRWPIWLVRPRLETMVGRPFTLNAVDP